MATDWQAVVAGMDRVASALLSVHPDGTEDGVALRKALRELAWATEPPPAFGECVRLADFHEIWKTVLENGLKAPASAKKTFHDALTGDVLQKTAGAVSTRAQVFLNRTDKPQDSGWVELTFEKGLPTQDPPHSPTWLLTATLKLKESTESVEVRTHFIVDDEALKNLALTASKVIQQLNKWP